MMAIAVSPIAMPISTRLNLGSGSTSCSGDFGYSKRVVTTAAETIKIPRPAASIMYSGQCWRRLSAHDRMGVVPSRYARSPDDCWRRWFHRSYWVEEPPVLHAPIALPGPYFFIELIARVASPGGDGQHFVFFFVRLPAATEHSTSTHRTLHGVFLSHREVAIDNCSWNSNRLHKYSLAITTG